MRHKCRWKATVAFVMLLVVFTHGDGESTFNKPATKTLFSPRMDYDQWKPVGRGDPLKNDPTFDYVPPVLEQVHYWIEPELRTAQQAESKSDGGPKTEMLLLGVPSKKPAISNPVDTLADNRRDSVYDAFPKYQDKNAFFNANGNQAGQQSSFFSSVTSQIIPSIMSFANKIMEKTLPRPDYFKAPFTVLIPPPPQITSRPLLSQFSSPVLKTPVTHKAVAFNPYASTTHNFPQTTTSDSSGVTVIPSNLIYHSSSIGSQKEFEVAPPVSWEFPSTTETHKAQFSHQQKLTPPKTVSRIPFSSKANPSTAALEASNSNHNINYVTPPPLNENRVVYKGQVSDDHDMSNTYVKIEKPQAQMDHVGVDVNNAPPTIIYSPQAQKHVPIMSHHVISQMEIMKPPPMPKHGTYARPYLSGILQKEKTSFESSNFIGSSSSITNTFVSSPTASPVTFATTTETSDNPTSTNSLASSATKSVTENPSALTTDPLFKHYKQPVEQVRGPPYLIIQGHSKVKTYKPAKQRNGIMVQDGNEIPYVREKTYDYSVKHLHGFEPKKDLLDISEQIANERKAKTGHLQTLKHVAETGYGAIDLEVKPLERSGQDLQETELSFGYQVPEDGYSNTEMYHQGIVEEVEKMVR
ncbi:uncharacterized protein LOC143204787 [Rhynchophorus ferrugineus]